MNGHATTTADVPATENDGCFSGILEHAANDDVGAFEAAVGGRDTAAVDEIGLWYGRRKGSGRQMVMEHRTALMVAATYGSLGVLRSILSLPGVDVNRSCGSDKATALHCAASGSSAGAVEAVKILIDAGADMDAEDADGLRPADVIVASSDAKAALEGLLGASSIVVPVPTRSRTIAVSTCSSSSHSPPLSSSPEEDGSRARIGGASDKKEYPVDPSLPDIKNSIFATDEFRMFSFKIRPCSRAYSHDWTECPFVHPGENARRRDPRKYHYSCVPCPDFRKGACRRGDLCEYAHGVFECWLHPAQYRTRLCKDGTGCARRVCFFAHTGDELRPLFMSTGSAVPSPRSSSMDMAAAMSLLSAGSPSHFTPPMSPSSGGNGHSPASANWPQPNVPTLHLPESNLLQSSRLRASLNARDMPIDDLQLMLNDHDAQFCFSDQGRFGSGGRQIRTNSLANSNPDDLSFYGEASSPRYASNQGGAVLSPSHKSAILNQFQQQQQSMLSPISTGSFSAKAMASLGISSPGRMSPRGGVDPISPLSNRASVFSQHQQHQQFRSLSSRDLFSGGGGGGSPVNSSWAGTNWGSPSGVLDWGVDGDSLRRMRRSSSSEMLMAGGEEPDVSWVHSLVRESPSDVMEKMAEPGGGGVGPSGSSSSQADAADQSAVIGDWLDQMILR